MQSMQSMKYTHSSFYKKYNYGHYNHCDKNNYCSSNYPTNYSTNNSINHIRKNNEEINKNDNKTKTFIHITKFVSYLFNFDQQSVENYDSGTSIEFSNMLFHNLENTLKSVILSNPEIENFYVVCPVYISKTTKNILDTQLSVTGKSFKNENESVTMIREIQEELGITILNCEKNTYFKNTLKYGNKTETSFIVDISDSRHFNPKQDVITKGIDNKYKKIRVLVCGKIEKILEIYKNIINRPDSNDIETIKFLRFISLKEFL